MSLGGALYKAGVPGEYTAREAAELKNFVGRAVAYAHQKGAVIVSAGNSAIDGDKDGALIHLPSDAPHAVSISATAPVGWATDPTNAFLDYPASYTNYGRSVISLAAPGGDFVYPGNEGCLIGGLLRPCWVFDLVFSSSGGVVGPDVYWYWSAGTSTGRATRPGVGRAGRESLREAEARAAAHGTRARRGRSRPAGQLLFYGARGASTPRPRRK